jgi:hypothetical protein
MVIGGTMTRSIVTLALLFLTVFAGRAAAQDHLTRWPHFRSGVPELLDALADGVRQSRTLRDLVEQLDTSDVVVYLVLDRSLTPPLAGHVSLMAAAGGRRYLRLSIAAQYSGRERIAILGDEVQHRSRSPRPGRRSIRRRSHPCTGGLDSERPPIAPSTRQPPSRRATACGGSCSNGVALGFRPGDVARVRRGDAR